MKVLYYLSLSLLSSLLLLPLHPHRVTSDLLDQICSTTSFIANSTYESNLNTLLTSVTTNATKSSTNFGFASDIVGSIPNQISGLVLCRGDVNSSTCSSCLTQASQEVQNLCPYNREAVIWYDYCLLRYSNERFLSSNDNSQQFYMWNPQNVTGSVTQFNNLVQYLLNATSDYAAFNNSKKFGTAHMNLTTPVPALYGLVQCTPDLSDSDCESCLNGLISNVESSLSGREGGRFVGVRCNFRYEIAKFYEGATMLILKPSEVAAPAPAPTLILPSPVGNSSSEDKKKTGPILAIAITVGLVSIAIFALCLCLTKRRRTELTQLLDFSNPEEIKSVESLLLELSVLRAATSNFAHENKLGEGGFGSVYKGVLTDGREIAVKRLSKNSDQGLDELKNELFLIAKLQHKNLVRLLGVCLEEKEKMLVYEYVPNKSIDQILFDDQEKKQMLDWEKRRKIIAGIARGLLYLHEDSRLKIIHRDLKASNVLLNLDMIPKISDFGLAKLFGGDQTRDITNRIVGTFGYMAPEYAMRGQFSIKSDVFSYGVLVLEIICGKKNSSTFENEEVDEDLLSIVWGHWIKETIAEIIDPSLGRNYPINEVLRHIQIGLLCVQGNPADRPTMSKVVIMLSRKTISLETPSKPPLCVGISGIRTDSFTDISNSIRRHHNEVAITNTEPR